MFSNFCAFSSTLFATLQHFPLIMYQTYVTQCLLLLALHPVHLVQLAYICALACQGKTRPPITKKLTRICFVSKFKIKNSVSKTSKFSILPFGYWSIWVRAAAPYCWTAPPSSTWSSGAAARPHCWHSWSWASVAGQRRGRTAPGACWTTVAGRTAKEARVRG